MSFAAVVAIWVGAAVLTVGLLGAAVAFLFPHLFRVLMRRLLSEPIANTLAELYVSVLSTPPLDLLYLSLRSETGDVVIRPMGSPKPVKGFDDLALVPAQLARPPLLEGEEVDLGVELGPRAHRPLELAIPMYVSGMAYGLALSKEARLALAIGSAAAKTALNSGQGPFFWEERRLAHRYILQYGRWTWNRDPEVLRAADMIEVQVGQGAMPGNAVLSHPGSIGPEIRKLMGLGPEDPPTIHARLFLDRPDRPVGLAEVVDRLREVVPDVPVAVKFGAGDDLEADVDVALAAGVDVIVIDGTEGATGNAPITLSDHFGLPTMVSLTRAVRHLERRGRRRDVSLVVSGGLREPGDFLKAIALGADAVALGTVPMIAIAHGQLTKALPYYPPTSLVFYMSEPRLALDPEEGGRNLANYFESCRREMAIALRTMGRRSLRELSPADLVTLDPDVARMTGVRLGFEAPTAPSLEASLARL